MKILSWTLKWGVKTNKQDIVEKIIKYKPDIIILSEFQYAEGNGKLIEELLKNNYYCDWANKSVNNRNYGVFIAIKRKFVDRGECIKSCNIAKNRESNECEDCIKIKFNKKLKHNTTVLRRNWLSVTLSNLKGYGFKNDELTVLGVKVPVLLKCVFSCSYCDNKNKTVKCDWEENSYCHSDKIKYWEEIKTFSDDMKEKDAVIIGDFNGCKTKIDDGLKNENFIDKNMEIFSNNSWNDAWEEYGCVDEKKCDNNRYTCIMGGKSENERRLDYAFISPHLVNNKSINIITQHIHNCRKRKGFIEENPKPLSDHSIIIVEINKKSDAE